MAKSSCQKTGRPGRFPIQNRHAGNLAVVCVANFVGAAGFALPVRWSGRLSMGNVGEVAVAIARSKVALGFWEAFFRGVLCNLLVCLAVWLAMAGRSVTDKILAIVFPITAFVACGFEHCVANMVFPPLGALAAPENDPIALSGVVKNLLPVTLGTSPQAPAWSDSSITSSTTGQQRKRVESANQPC